MIKISKKAVGCLSVSLCVLFFSSTTQAATITLNAGDVVGKYNDDVAVSVSSTLRGNCRPGAPLPWTCNGSSTPHEAQVEFISTGVDMEAFGSVSVALESDQYQIDSLSTLNAQITGQVRYDGTMYVFQNNGADLLGLVEVATGQLGTKVQTIITVALVDVTDPDKNYEVGNTTVLDTECEAAYEIALGVSVLANKCTHVLQPTYSFNAIVQPGHTYKIVTELRCDGHVGSPGLNVIGCKYGPQWDGLGDGAAGIAALGPIGAYTTSINAIGRPGGLIWANSTISLGEDVAAQTNRLITRLETTLSLIGSLENRDRQIQQEEIKAMISQHDIDVNASIQAVKSKLDEVEALVTQPPGHRYRNRRGKKDSQ